jgi:hypothetical protein
VVIAWDDAEQHLAEHRHLDEVVDPTIVERAFTRFDSCRRPAMQTRTQSWPSKSSAAR